MLPATLRRRRPSGSQVNVIDDPDHAGVGRRFTGQERKGGFTSPNKKHAFAHTGADGVQSDNRPAHGTGISRDRLHEQQLVSVEIRVLHGGHDVADDLRQLHDAYPMVT